MSREELARRRKYLGQRLSDIRTKRPPLLLPSQVQPHIDGSNNIGTKQGGYSRDGQRLGPYDGTPISRRLMPSPLSQHALRRTLQPKTIRYTGDTSSRVARGDSGRGNGEKPPPQEVQPLIDEFDAILEELGGTSNRMAGTREHPEDLIGISRHARMDHIYCS